MVTRTGGVAARRRRRLATGALIAAAALLTAVPGAGADAGTPSKPRLEPCKEAKPDGMCGTVTVPLDRSDPSRGTIDVFFRAGAGLRGGTRRCSSTTPTRHRRRAPQAAVRPRRRCQRPRQLRLRIGAAAGEDQGPRTPRLARQVADQGPLVRVLPRRDLVRGPRQARGRARQPPGPRDLTESAPRRALAMIAWASIPGPERRKSRLFEGPERGFFRPSICIGFKDGSRDRSR